MYIHMKIAVVDDDKEFTDRIEGYLADYAKERAPLTYHCDVFREGASFLTAYKPYDLVLLDVEMPVMNGLETAKRLRKIDENVTLMFLTNMAQYAIRGYEVDALDYILKPVEYRDFCAKLDRVAMRIQRSEKKILFKTPNGLFCVYLSKVFYAEKSKNYILYHTPHGNFSERGSIAEHEEQLQNCGFVKISRGCYVNMRYIDKIEKQEVCVAGERLPVSRLEYKSFLDTYMRFVNES